jgi:hypothetical protein
MASKRTARPRCCAAVRPASASAPRGSHSSKCIAERSMTAGRDERTPFDPIPGTVTTSTPRQGERTEGQSFRRLVLHREEVSMALRAKLVWQGRAKRNSLLLCVICDLICVICVILDRSISFLQYCQTAWLRTWMSRSLRGRQNHLLAVARRGGDCRVAALLAMTVRRRQRLPAAPCEAAPGQCRRLNRVRPNSLRPECVPARKIREPGGETLSLRGGIRTIANVCVKMCNARAISGDL